FPKPTPEQRQRWQERQRAAAKRYAEKQRERAKVHGAVITSRLPRENRKRKAKRREEAFGPAGFVEWVHSLGCSVPECQGGPIEVAHARSRGAGGNWTDTLPLCKRHHDMQHKQGIRTFERHVGFDLAAVAALVHDRWERMNDG